MTTTKSFSSTARVRSIFKRTFRSQLPFMIVIGIAFFLCISLPTIMELIYYPPSYQGYTYLYSGIYLTEELSIVVYVFSAIAAFILAISVNSYMHSKRMVDLYHSIPVTRTQMLAANSISSMLTFTIPLAANIALTAVIQMFAYRGLDQITMRYFWFILQDLLGAFLYFAVIFFFVGFIATKVGTAFDTLAVAGVLGISVLFLYTVSGLVWSGQLYGASFEPTEEFLLLSPFSFIFYKYTFLDYSRSEIVFPVGPTLLFYLICLVAAGLLCWLTIWSYNNRKSEIAEKTQSSGIFSILVKVVASFAGAALLYLIFFDTSNVVVQAIAVIIGALLLGTVAELILSRGIRFLKKNIKWLLGTGVVCAVALIVVTFDLTGYVRRVPVAESVSSVSIHYSGRFESLNSDNYSMSNTVELTEAQAIQLVADAHKSAVDHYFADDSSDTRTWTDLTIRYKLKNGGTIQRQYSRIDSTSYAILAQLENRPEFIQGSSPLFLDKINGLPIGQQVAGILVTNGMQTKMQSLAISAADTDRLIQAVRQDMLAEPLREILSPSKPALGYLTFSFIREGSNYVGDTQVVITEQYGNTVALLRELGAYDTLTASSPAPDKIFVIPNHYRYIPGNQVYTVAPGQDSEYINKEVYSYMQAEDGYGTATMSQEEVDKIVSAARNQMFVFDDTEGINATYLAVFTTDGVVTGHLLIRYRDLPQRMQEALVASLGDWYTGTEKALPFALE